MARLLAGIAQLVERNLAKVEVASSNLVSRSRLQKPGLSEAGFFCAWSVLTFRACMCTARWQSGYAAACKAVYAGSIPTLASTPSPGWRNW